VSDAPTESKLGDDDVEHEEQDAALAFLRAGRAEAFLLTRLAAALRVARIHSLDNVAARESLEELRDGLNRFLVARERASIIVGEGKRIYVNGRLVRAGKAGGAWLEDLVDILERAGAGGLLLGGAWDAAATRELVAAFAPAPGVTDVAARFVALGRGLSRLALPALAQPLTPAAAAASAQEEEEGYLSESQRAAFYFARLIALAEAALESVRAGRSPDVLSRHLRQTLMKVVDMLAHPLFEARLIGCGVFEVDGVDPLAAHAARVTALSLVMGRLLGLTRGNQGDLGLAALYHDLGRAELERQPAASGDAEEPASVEAAALQAVRYGLRGRSYATAGLLRLIVGLEHHRDADGIPDQPALRPSHVFSQLVGIADAFDRLEHGLPWRKAMSPAAALQTLAAQPERYAPGLVELLIDALGRTPRGTLLQLRTGELVVVVSGGARQGHRPILRRLMLATGAPDPELTLARLESLDLVVTELDPDVEVDWRRAVIS
jgi:hypothetical protein